MPLKRLIIERTEGNPFFMEEMVQALFEQGALVRNGAVKLTSRCTRCRSRPRCRAILAARIDRLPAEREGTAADPRGDGPGVPVRPDQARDAANPMTNWSGCSATCNSRSSSTSSPRSGDTEYTFKHALTLEVAYNSLLVERRRLLHERAAQAIEALFSDRLEDHLAELAHHYERSGNARKAVEYLGARRPPGGQRTAHSEAVGHSTGPRICSTNCLAARSAHAANWTRPIGVQLGSLYGFGVDRSGESSSVPES